VADVEGAPTEPGSGDSDGRKLREG